jgi:hypothetical protein
MFEQDAYEKLYDIANQRLNVLKECIADILDEANRNVIRQGRAKIIRVRVRGGKVQRRKKLSAVKGYTIRGGKMVRMSPRERLKRKMGARRAKVKRRAKKARALMKRKRSLRKRAALGLK